ncbi:synaptopodin 2-like protein [Genypterus blacodes]|uniref:synaptopodin 2-like protein n=1 Tax=Genypterus blacodes TaxID=154954 RepID=UPI003F776E53
MVAEEIVVSLSGGAPWGFRLQGGAEHQKPLQVAKVRRRSKACRAGLKEHDELVAIDNNTCADLSHAQAVSIIDTQSGTLNLRVKRTPSGLHASSYTGSSTSAGTSGRALSPLVEPVLSHLPCIFSPTVVPRGITSPPDSEAYYGETDSDADTQAQTHRRQRRTPPHARSPARYDNQEEEETSEMSGYESATEVGLSFLGVGHCPPGVPRRELIYQPIQTEWATPVNTPHTLTPHTLTPTPDQGLVDGEGEGDSGFQESGGCIGMTCPPLVSPERAKEALMLDSGKQLVPMVGLQQTPVSDELSTTYKDKARQARLHRGESLVEKQVKEACTKCRSIASLLTDAPNPNSKGVLMFKKRRQRAKKYTLTCFGKVEGDRGEDTEGDTGGETEEEGGSSVLSGSEVEEEGFSASYDPTWDSGYLDLLDRRSSACPSAAPTTPTTPTTNHMLGLDASTYQSPGFMTFVNQSPGFDVSGLDASAYQGSRPESNGINKQISAQPAPKPAHMSPPAVALTNGGSVAVSRASVLLSPPSQTPLLGQNGQNGSHNPIYNPNISPTPITNSDPNLINNGPNPAGNLNRTARPFTPGPTPSRANVTTVMFRPPQPKPMTVAAKPATAVSMMTIQPTRHSSVPDARRAVSSTSLYIPARNNNSNSTLLTTPSVASPPSSVVFSQPPSYPQPFSPQSSMHCSPLSPPSAQFSTYAAQSPPVYPSPSQHFSPPAPHTQPLPSPPAPNDLPLSPQISAPPISTPQPTNIAQVYNHTQPQPPPSLPFNPYVNIASTATATPPQPPSSDSMATREQRISAPLARSGILSEARRRSSNKPMFCSVQNKDISPNPDLLSMVQTMDDRFVRIPGAVGSGEHGVGANGEVGHESGPEEDWLRLGAEACNFMQAQRGPKPPQVAPKPQAPQAPQAPQMPQLGGKGGQLFARRQNQMDRYVVERSPSVAAAPYSPAQTRQPSPTPSLPSTWKYSPNIRAPPPISYNPLLSPSCPLKAQKKPDVAGGKSWSGGKKAGKQKGKLKPLDIMAHQPYQLNSSLFSYGGGVPQDRSTLQQQQGMTGGSQGPTKTARVYEVKRFSTPPPTATGPALKVIVPRSATTLGEPMWRSDVLSSPPSNVPYQPYPPQPQWSPAPPAPTAPLPQLPALSSAPNPVPSPALSHLQTSNAAQANRQFKSAPNLSPLGPVGASQLATSGNQPQRVPRPRFSTSNLGLQPCVWRPGANMH